MEGLSKLTGGLIATGLFKFQEQTEEFAKQNKCNHTVISIATTILAVVASPFLLLETLFTLIASPFILAIEACIAHKNGKMETFNTKVTTFFKETVVPSLANFIFVPMMLTDHAYDIKVIPPRQED